MDEIYIYKDFELLGMIQGQMFLKWTRRYNFPGEFILQLAETSEIRDLISRANIIYKGKDGEAAFIEDYTSTRDSEGNTLLEVSGRFLSSILERRIFSLSVQAPVKTIIDRIISENFTTPANLRRKIPEFRQLEYTPSNNPTVSVDYKNYNALTAISELCGQYQIGFTVLFSPSTKSYNFMLYSGRETAVIFSFGFKNVLEQDYYNQTRNARNVCIVQYGASVQTVNDNIEGAERREVFLSANTSNGLSAEKQAGIRLNDLRRRESFDTVVNGTSPQLGYKSDWDLGDVVTSENENWGKTIRQNVPEITEYFDKGGLHLTPVFGDPILTELDRQIGGVSIGGN